MLDFETINPPIPTKVFLTVLVAGLLEKKFKLVKLKTAVSKIGTFAEEHPDEYHLLGGLRFRTVPSGFVCEKLEGFFRDVAIDTDYLRKTMDDEFLFVSMSQEDHDKVLGSIKPEFRDYILAMAEFVAQKEGA